MAFERGLQDIGRIIDEEERSKKPATGGATVPPRPAAGATAKRVGVKVAVRSAVARGDSAWLKARHAERPLTNIIDWDSGGLPTLAAANNQREVLALLVGVVEE
jgi:hypothetical protein